MCWKIPPSPDSSQPGFLRDFDWGGAILLGAAIASLLCYVSSRLVTGVAPLQDWRLLAATVLFVTGLIAWESRQAEPFVPLSIFRHRLFNQASFCSAARMFALSATIFLVPLYLADVHGLPLTWIGPMLTLLQTAIVATMVLGGTLADSWTNRGPVFLGMAGVGVGLIFLACLPGTASLVSVAGGLLVTGLALGLSLPALHRAAVNANLESQMGAAAGLYSTIRFIGDVLGTAVAGVVLQQGLDWGLQPVYAHQFVFWILAGVALAGAIVGLMMKG
jgi:MFS family permease